jgi:hypothetical protein
MLLCLAVISNPTRTPGASADPDLEQIRQALKIIEDHASKLCSDIPIVGEGSSLELNGNAKIELNSILKKLADAKLEGATKYNQEKYTNVLQKDLANTLKNSTDCKLEIFRTLKDFVLPTNKTKQTSGHTILKEGFTSFSESGFNFNTQEIVSWDSKKADILVARPQHEQVPLFFLPYDTKPYEHPEWDTHANSGIRLITQAKSLNNIDCPTDNYSYHWYKPMPGSYYCVRTRNGRGHIAIYVDSVSDNKIGFDYLETNN